MVCSTFANPAGEAATTFRDTTRPTVYLASAPKHINARLDVRYVLNGHAVVQLPQTSFFPGEECSALPPEGFVAVVVPLVHLDLEFLAVKCLEEVRQRNHTLANELDRVKLVPEDESFPFEPTSQGTAFIICLRWHMKSLPFSEDVFY
jgi:hypothetical protein